MMATPADLEDFAVGFALTEGLIDTDTRALDVEIVASELGIELRSWLPGERQGHMPRGGAQWPARPAAACAA